MNASSRVLPAFIIFIISASESSSIDLSTPVTQSLMDVDGRHAATNSITSSAYSNPSSNDLLSTVVITAVMVLENCNSSGVANRNKKVDASYNPHNVRRLGKK